MITLPDSEINAVILDLDWSGATLPAELMNKLRSKIDETRAIPVSADGWRCLARVSSFEFSTRQLQRPFSPVLVTTTGSSTGPEDLTDEELDWLHDVAPAVLCVGLRARMSDVVWVRKRKVASARTAIDAYLALGLVNTLNSHGFESEKAIRRACQLAKQISPPESPDRAAVHKAIFGKATLEMKAGHWAIALRLAGVLGEFSGLPEKTGRTLLRRILSNIPPRGSGMGWEHLLDRVLGIARAITDEDIARKSQQMVASGRERTAKADEKRQDFLRASLFWQQALEAHRKAKASKATLDRVQTRLINANRKSRPQMQSFQTTFNTKSMVLEAVKKVRGTDPLDAMLMLAHLVPLPNLEEERKHAEELLEGSIADRIATTMRVDSAGRSSGIAPSYHSSDPKEKETALRQQVIEMRQWHWQVSAVATILPALQAINAEHPDLDQVIKFLVVGSPAIPDSRKEAFARGLILGLDGDFASAISLLIPQMEHLIRELLERQGIAVTRLNQDGGQEERSLGSLLSESVLESLMPINLIDELRALLDERGGPRLRHSFAHGKLSYDQLAGNLSSYCWWLALRIVAMSSLEHSRRSKPS